MTLDHRRRAPVLVGLVAVAVGAILAGSATAFGPQLVSGNDRLGSWASLHGPTPHLTDRPPPTPAGIPAPSHGTRRRTSSPTPSPAKPSTSAKPSTTTSQAPSSTPPSTTTQPKLAPAPGQTQQVLNLVNQARADAGCAPLHTDSSLTKAAQSHSEDMSERDYFSHDTPEGVTFDKRIKAAGYPSPGAENIAMGQRSADQVMNDWMHSSGHRRNILNCQLTAIGVGLDTQGWYWTQDFGY